MIIIRHTVSAKNPFSVRHTGKNGEPLKSSETLSSKKNCYKNILADLTENYKGCNGVWIEDTTIDAEPVFYAIGVLKQKAGVKS